MPPFYSHLKKIIILNYIQICIFFSNKSSKNHGLNALIDFQNAENCSTSNVSDNQTWDIISDVILIQDKYEDTIKTYYQKMLEVFIKYTENFFKNKFNIIIENKLLVDSHFENNLENEIFKYYKNNKIEFENCKKLKNLVENLRYLESKYFVKSINFKKLILNLGNTIFFVKNMGTSRLKSSINLVAGLFLKELRSDKSELMNLDFTKYIENMQIEILNNILGTFGTKRTTFLLTWLIDDIEKFNKNSFITYDPFYSKVIKNTINEKNTIESNLFNKYSIPIDKYCKDEILKIISCDIKAAYNSILRLKNYLSHIYDYGYLNCYNNNEDYVIYNRNINKNIVKTFKESKSYNGKKIERFFDKIYKYYNHMLKSIFNITKDFNLYYDIIKHEDYNKIEFFLEYFEVFQNTHEILLKKGFDLKNNFDKKMRHYNVYKKTLNWKILIPYKYIITKQYFRENIEFYTDILKITDFLQCTMFHFVHKIYLCLEAQSNGDKLKTNSIIHYDYFIKIYNSEIKDLLYRIWIILFNLKTLFFEINPHFKNNIQKTISNEFLVKTRKNFYMMNKYVNALETELNELKRRKLFSPVCFNLIKKSKISENTKILHDIRDFFNLCQQNKDKRRYYWGQRLHSFFSIPSTSLLENLHNELQNALYKNE